MIDQISQEHMTTKQQLMMTAITILEHEQEREPLAAESTNNSNTNNSTSGHLFNNQHRDHNNNNNNNNDSSSSSNNSNDNNHNDSPEDLENQRLRQHQRRRECHHQKLASGARRGSASNIMRQLGRRVSLFPQVLARQLSSTAAATTTTTTTTGSQQQQQQQRSQSSGSTLSCRTSSNNNNNGGGGGGTDDEDTLRRFSLPMGVSPTPNSPNCHQCFLRPSSSIVVGDVDMDHMDISGGGGGGSSSSSAEDSPLQLHAQQVVEVPTTVAGVGGTITTVTRSKRKTAPLPRLVAKNGQVNLFLDNIDRRQYMRDLFTTMIDIKWRYNLMAAAFGFVFSWLFFACIWYVVLYVHNDLEHEGDPNWSPCIVNVHSFPAALLFSIETQSTLGFGSRIISVECPGAILIFCSQLIFGVVVECLIVGMVFAKLSRPTKRSQTIMYSKYATVCLREGKMCLTFRVGDVRSKSHIIGATLRASLVSSKVTQEGELIPFYHHKLKVFTDDCKNSLLLIWPVTIVHVIDETSPFYKLNSDELINFKFEIITVLEGTVESTGQSIQVRSSYLPSEVKWGYRFEPIVSTHGYGKYAQTIIDYNKFNRIIEVATPKCSPMDYYADQRELVSHAAQIKAADIACEQQQQQQQQQEQQSDSCQAQQKLET